MNENPWKDELLERYLLGEFSREEVNEPLERYLLGRFSQERVDELFRRYLLGELSQKEEDELELHLSMNRDLFDLAEAVEADLLAAADRGELAPAERERILNRLASFPQGRERLALVSALNKAADEERGTTPNVARFPRRDVVSRPVVQWATALAASLLIATGLTWYAIEKERDARAEQQAEFAKPPVPKQTNGHSNPVMQKPPEKQPLPAPVQPSPDPDQVARYKKPEEHKEQPVTKPVEPLRAVLALALTTQRDAGGEVDKISLTPDLDFVDLQLDVDSENQSFESFDVTLRKEQETILQEKGLKPQQLDWGKVLVLEVPAKELTVGTRYEVQVQGVAAEGTTEPPPSFAEFEVVTGGQP